MNFDRKKSTIGPVRDGLPIMNNDPMTVGTSRKRPEFLNNLDTSNNHSSHSLNGEAGPISRRVRIVNPQGLHMRPAAAFAQLARQYTGPVVVRNGDRHVDGKSWVDLMLLAAVSGTELVVEVSGPDADDALDALTDMLASDDGSSTFSPQG